MHKFIFLGVLPALALAGRSSTSFFLRRNDGDMAQSCSELGLQRCGTGCIPSDHICCPGNKGGCPPDSRCMVGDDGEDGCCRDGFVCTGNGGASETTFVTSTTSSDDGVAPLPDPTPTSPDDDGVAPLPDPTNTAEESTSSTSTDEGYDRTKIPGPTLLPEPPSTTTETSSSSTSPADEGPGHTEIHGPTLLPEPSPTTTTGESSSSTAAADGGVSSTSTPPADEGTSTSATTEMPSETSSTAVWETTNSAPQSVWHPPLANSTTFSTVLPPSASGSPSSPSASSSSSSSSFFSVSSSSSVAAPPPPMPPVSTVYSTTTQIVTSCPATHRCHTEPGATGPVTIVTETVAASTITVPSWSPEGQQPPPPPPQPTITKAPSNSRPGTTVLSSVVTPQVSCPGGGKGFYPIDGSSRSSSSVTWPVSSALDYTPTGTGGSVVYPTSTGIPVTAGAPRARMGLTGAAGAAVLGFAAAWF